MKRSGYNILTRDEILDYMSPRREVGQRLFVSPLLDGKQVGDTSIDLRLGQRFLVSEPSRLGVLDLVNLHHEGKGVLRDNYREVRVPFGTYFTLHPRSTVQIGTMEYLGIPADLQGIVTPRASVSDIPIITNAAQVHPGHREIVTLTLTSNAEFSIRLYPGVRIAELQLQVVNVPVSEPRGSRYHTITRPVPTKLYEDRDLAYLGPTVEPIIVGIASTIAAGRTTAIGHLKNRHGFGSFSLADVLKREAFKLGVLTARTELQELGRRLRESHGDACLAVRLRASQEWLGGAWPMVVVDSFKHVAEVEEFRKQRRFKLLAIDASADERWKRMKQRGRLGDPLTQEKFLQQNATDRGLDGAPHGQQLARLLEMADEVIINDGTMQEFLAKIDRFVKNVLPPSSMPED